MNHSVSPIRIVCLALLAMVQLSAFAAPATANYFCDFEDVAENAQWISWGGSAITRMKHSTWKTGGAAYCSGEKGMYISDLDIDSVGGNTHSYPKNSGYSVSAYRKMTLDAGTYVVSLDYKCPSELLSVSLLRADTLDGSTIQTQTGSDYAATVKNSIVDGLKDLKSSTWNHASANQLVAQAGTYLLVITYRTSSGPDLPFGAAVDNVEVVKYQNDPTACDYAITDLRVDLESGYAALSWHGNADSYEVRYFDSYGNGATHGVVLDGGDVDSCHIPLENMDDGTYSFMVRGLGCDGNDNYTGWTYLRHKLIYDPAAHCIDFLNFDARGVVCKYGTGDWDGSSTERITGTTVGYTDYGSESQYNTHTIHFKPNERDAMTDNMLRTVPEGSFASVRLGSREPNNQYPGSHWQSVSYTIRVTEEIGVVLFRYAYIGQTGGHSGLEQSHIRLRLTDQTGAIINGEECGSILFTSPTNDSEMEIANRNPRTAGWHKGLQDSGEGSVCNSYVYWRDWTTVGINVQDYIGQDIKIEVINYGCGQSCHYGYCYFVLDCSKGEIVGQTCGEKPRELTVDEGFDYRWYTPYDPNHQFAADQDPTSRSLENIALNDTNTYYCDLMRKGNNACYFTLHAPAIARLPRAQVEVKHEPKDCQNYMIIENKSAIYGFYTNEAGQLDSVARDDEFQSLITWTSVGGRRGQLNATGADTILFANAGDLVTLTMSITMKEGCTDEKTISFAVPAIGPTIGRDTIRFAQGETVLYHEHTYTEPGDETIPMVNAAGCDSSLYLHLDRLDPVTIDFYDTICRSQGQIVDSVTKIVIPSRSLKYQNSDQYADSVYEVTHHTIFDELVTRVDPMGRICADDDSMYIAVRTNLQSVVYNVLFDERGHAAGFEDIVGIAAEDISSISIPIPDGVRPDKYTVVLVVEANDCGATTDSIPFGVSYASTIAPQKWDNVLVLLDTDNNGGYAFSGIQWYKNGQPIPGATQPSLYLGKGQDFDPNAEYTVGLIRAGETEEIISCPLGDLYTGIEDAPVVAELPLTFDGQMTLYDVLGRVVMQSQYNYDALMQWMHSHNARTIYLVCLQSQDSKQTFRVMTK